MTVFVRVRTRNTSLVWPLIVFPYGDADPETLAHVTVRALIAQLGVTDR